MSIFHPLPEEKVFNDAVHGYIHVTDHLIWQLINTPEFQRLRRISQLGGSRMVFSSAEHSRFSHGLGAYELSRSLLEKVADVKKSLTEFEQLTVLCAALLHDVGHGPYSHAFEQIHPVAHEYYSVLLITHPETKIYEVLAKVDPLLPQAIAEAIQSIHPNPIVNQLISSPLDVDRLDYLLRDAYHTGTPYGKLDLERLFRVMTVYQGRIAFKQSGVPALENYFVGRSHMYQSVYYHPVSVSYEFILEKMIHRMKTLHQTGYKFRTAPTLLIPFFGSTPVSVSAHQRLDDHVVSYYVNVMQGEKDPILVDLAMRLQQRKLLEAKVIKSDDELNDIKQRIHSLHYDSTCYFGQITLPQKTYDTSSPYAIQIVTGSETVELSTLSEVVASLSKPTHATTLTIFPRECYGRV